MRGGSLQALKELLGHADLKMTLRYAHLSPDHLRAEVEKTEKPGENTNSGHNGRSGPGTARLVGRDQLYDSSHPDRTSRSNPSA